MAGITAPNPGEAGHRSLSQRGRYRALTGRVTGQQLPIG